MAKEKGNLAFAIIIALAFTTVIAAGSYFVYYKTFVAKEQEKQIACTQEAKICPDGSAVGRTGPNCEFAQCPESFTFGSLINFTIGKQIKFSDGLTVTLKKIDDSRCKQGVVCVWAGELSPVFAIIGGNSGNSEQEIRLGASTSSKVTKNGYVFELKNVSETFAEITVAKESATLGNCYIGGCSGQICSDKEGLVTTCEYKEEYECYKSAKCERQTNGQCGWTTTQELILCLNAK